MTNGMHLQVYSLYFDFFGIRLIQVFTCEFSMTLVRLVT